MSEIISGPAAPHPRRIRRLSIEDAAACAALVETVGWHADEARWRMFLSVGVGFGVEREDGALAGVVMVHPFGAGLASIAMMMVEPSQQRRGLGALLMRAALAHATPATIFLYASEAGEPLYANLGFVIRGNTTRFEGRVELPPPAPHDGLRPIGAHDLPGILALDERSQGAPRAELLRVLLDRAARALVVERGGVVVAFGLASTQDDRRLLAPIVAVEPGDAIALAAHLAAGPTVLLRMDIPDEQPHLRAWAASIGLVAGDRTALMTLDGRPLPGARAYIHALAGRPFG